MIPEECQSIPITHPSAWNQNGSLEPGEEFGRAVVVDDALGDRRPERRHALGKPRRDASAMQRQVGDAGAFHGSIVAPAHKLDNPVPAALIHHERDRLENERALVSRRVRP